MKNTTSRNDCVPLTLRHAFRALDPNRRLPSDLAKPLDFPVPIALIPAVAAHYQMVATAIPAHLPINLLDPEQVFLIIHTHYRTRHAILSIEGTFLDVQQNTIVPFSSLVGHVTHIFHLASSTSLLDAQSYGANITLETAE